MTRAARLLISSTSFTALALGSVAYAHNTETAWPHVGDVYQYGDGYVSMYFYSHASLKPNVPIWGVDEGLEIDFAIDRKGVVEGCTSIAPWGTAVPEFYLDCSFGGFMDDGGANFGWGTYDMSKLQPYVQYNVRMNLDFVTTLQGKAHMTWQQVHPIICPFQTPGCMGGSRGLNVPERFIEPVFGIDYAPTGGVLSCQKTIQYGRTQTWAWADPGVGPSPC